MAWTKVFPSGSTYDLFDRTGAGSSPDLGASYSDLRTNNGRTLIGTTVTQVVKGSIDWPTDYPPFATIVASWSGTNNQYAEVKVHQVGTGGNNQPVGVVVRASGDTDDLNCYYAHIYYYNALAWRLYFGKMTSSGGTVTNTPLYSGNAYRDITFAAGDRLGLEHDGTNITVYRNGVALTGEHSVADTSIASGSPGLTASGSGETNREFADDFQAGDVTSGSSVAPKAAYYRMMQGA